MQCIDICEEQPTMAIGNLLLTFQLQVLTAILINFP